MDPLLVDQIYEAAFLPELWPEIIDKIAKLADALGGFFFALNADGLRWTSSAFLRVGMEKLAHNNWLERGQRLARLRQAAHPGFLTEADLYRNNDLSKDPFYTEFLWKLGAGWGAGTVIESPTGDTLVVSFERAFARGPVEPDTINQLNGLRPHLARTTLLSARLRLERARAVGETLALLGIPALVCNDSGKVLAANNLIQTMNEPFLWRARDHFSLRDAKADQAFKRAIAGRDEKPSCESVRSFPLRDLNGNAAFVAHVLPIRGDAQDIFSLCTNVLVLAPIALPTAPPVELIQSLFDLTPAEARVARSLVIGGTIEGIAQVGKVSRNTVRTHVRGVLEKTGCRRQAEVVALLGGIALPGT